MANEPVPQPYPTPQVEVHLARDVGPTIQPQPARAAQVEIIEGDWSEVRESAKAKPGILQQLWEAVPRIGDGHFTAWLRLGGKEWTQVLAAFPDSNVRPADEPGIFGVTTPQIVTEQMGHQDYDHTLSMYAARGGANEQDRGITR